MQTGKLLKVICKRDTMQHIFQNKKICVFFGIFFVFILVFIVPVAAENAWFDVTSLPSGAYVCMDGYYSCDYTPETWAVTAFSHHTFTVYLDGYQTWSEDDWAGSDGTTTAVYAQLVPTPTAIGWLDVNNPNGADIWIDGVYYGNGASGVALSPGGHTLELQKAGYYDYTSTVSITAGQTTTTTPGMTPYATNSGYGDLQISSTPAGAAVYVNNNYEGTTPSGSPLYVTQLNAGVYNVVLSMPDYQSYTQTATVEPGIVNDIWATMVPVTPGPTPDTTGQINVGSSPSGANIFLDNAYKGITPMVLSNVPQGTHTLLLKTDGYQSWTSSVTVTAGSYTQVSGTLSPAAQPTPSSQPTSPIVSTQPTVIPQPTKSGLSPIIALGALGICGAAIHIRKKE
jgi:hypothetical protein